VSIQGMTEEWHVSMQGPSSTEGMIYFRPRYMLQIVDTCSG